MRAEEGRVGKERRIRGGRDLKKRKYPVKEEKSERKKKKEKKKKRIELQEEKSTSEEKDGLLKEEGRT